MITIAMYSNWIIKTDSYDPSINSQIWAGLLTQNPLNKGNARFSCWKTPQNYQNFILLTFLKTFP